MPFIAPAFVELTERHQIDVVVDQYRSADVLTDESGDVEAIPARHDRRVAGLTGRKLDRTRNTDPDTGDLVDPSPRAVEHGRPDLVQPGQHLLRPVGDLDRLSDFTDRLRAEIGDRNGRVGRPEIGSQHHPRMWVERKPSRRASTGRASFAGRADESQGDQFIHPGGDGRTSEPGQFREFGTCSAATVAQKLKKISRRKNPRT